MKYISETRLSKQLINWQPRERRKKRRPKLVGNRAWLKSSVLEIFKNQIGKTGRSGGKTSDNIERRSKPA